MQRVSFAAVYVAASLALFLLSLFVPVDQGAVADVRLADAGKATLDYLVENGKLVGILNTALFSACGALAIKGRDWSTQWGRVEGHLIVLALVAGAVSYYGTYMTHMAILEMVYSGIIDPFSRRLVVALNIQYYGILIGVFLVGLVFSRMLAARKPAPAATPDRPAT